MKIIENPFRAPGKSVFGRFGGRASDKSGVRDMAMDDWSPEARKAAAEARHKHAHEKSHRLGGTTVHKWGAAPFSQHLGGTPKPAPFTREEAKAWASRDEDEYRDEQFEKAELARGEEEDRHGRWGGRGSDKAGARDNYAMDPLTDKGEEIMSNMKKEYGPAKGESVFYASANKGKITGVHG